MRIIYLMLIGAMLSSCSSVDPAASDLKSPCVANDDGSQITPCVRRNPLENLIA
jgi:hypothetical protein